MTGGSETARLIVAHDWSGTLGPVSGWPQSLKTVVGMITHSPVAMVLLWGDDGIMIYNDAYGVFAGNRHPGLLGMKVLEAWPEAADLNSEVMRVCMAGGTLAFKERELVLNRRGKPESAWMDLFYSPVIDESGKPGGVIAVVVETTERVLASRNALAERARLAESERRLDMALSAGHGIGTWDWDVPNDRVVADARFAGLYGVDPEKARQGAPIGDFFAGIHPADLPRVQAAVELALKAGADFSEEYRLVQPDGSIRWVAAQGRCTLDADGRPLRFPGVSFDISSRKAAEVVLRDNESRFAFLDTLGRDAARHHDADSILAATTGMVARHMGVSICAYADMDADQDGFTIRGEWSTPGAASILGHYRLADFGRLAVETLSAGRPLVIRDAVRELAPHESATFQAIGISATICLPLVKEGRLTALMAVHDGAPRDWTENDIALLADVTQRSWAHVERVRTEAALRDSAERLRLATDAAQIGTFDFNPVTGVLRWDDRCKALFGLSPDDDVTYDLFLQGLHPDDRDWTDHAVQSAFDPDGAGKFEVEYRVIGLRDGVQRWIAATGHVFFEARVPVRFVGTVLDISAQKRAEAVLRESEAQFRNMAQAMPNHVWTATADGLLDWLNDQVPRYAGLPQDALTGNGWTGIVHSDDMAHAGGAWVAALAAGSAYETEFRLRRADGAFRWHIARAVPVKDAAGTVTRWIGTNTDIQDQKETAAVLADLNATLEKRVAERTHELEEAQEALRQAQKMEAVGQLTGGIAHDFNNLLQGITGALDRVHHRITQGRPQEAERFIKAALESANRAAALTHRLLAFSRRQTLDPSALDANRLIAGMEDLIRRTMGPNVSVEVVGAGGLWPIRVDASQLENSLLNLCINARDAMPGGGKLTIETANKWFDDRGGKERELAPGQYVSLCVTDSGTGMTPEVIARAFDPFFTTKPLGQGTGLGLSMIYGFVRQSGGQVRIYSEAEQGTTMCLYFPRHMGEVEEDAGPSDETVERGFGETVLVVDDEPTVRMLVSEVLSEGFYNIIEAGDGPSALKVLESSRRIDLMITDVGLPGGMNGRQVADAARVLRKDLKVLFITGYAENAVVGNGHLEAGMEILAKPFAMSTLANKVREMIET